MNRVARGFTLLELLIAVSVFALMSAIAYGGLRSVLHARAATDEQAAALRELQLAEMFLAGDLRSLIARPVRDDYGDSQGALRVDELGEQRLVLTRAGWSNPLDAPRSELQRVAWGIEDGHLVRLYWPTLDRLPGSEALRVELLAGVQALGVRLLDAAGQWHTQWPDERAGVTSDSTLPRAIEVTLETERYGAIRRLYPLDARGG